MPLQTDLNASYFDDYDEAKNYYKILFRPDAAVQARELNQIQSILQSQIERFGDNVFKRGTIIEGCNVTLHQTFPYIKIKDAETNGTQVDVSSYENLYLKNSANLTAYVVKTVAGYESKSPDLNTIYVKYNSSGDDGNTTTFAANDILTVYDPSYPLFKFKVNDGSSGFANTDTVVILPAIAIQNSSGGSTFTGGAFTVNDIINNGVANAIIVEANTTVNTEFMVLKIKPVAGDLKSANTLLWRFANSENIINLTTSNTAKIVEIIGTGAQAALTTDSLGKVTAIDLINSGSGYYVPPHVGVSITTSGSAISNNNINQLDVEAWNYLTNITVANSATDPVGTGYGITVDQGTIYQKGYFSSVEEQLIIVNKYSNTGFTKSAGFYTDEEIINAYQDESLFDNATGSPNETAPGADRLRLTPTLYVIDKEDAEANTEFLPIVEWADGVPYKNTPQTVYNVIGDEIAKRTFEESGNYVLDQFLLTSKDSDTFSETPSVFKMLIDPGKAYINGYRIETTNNYSSNVSKGLDTINNTNATIRVGYGNYIVVKELAGIFQFNYGDIVNLYDTAATYITTNPGSAISPAGNLIGTARMRSLLLDSGEPGSYNAEYRLYLFDIVMATGKNFSAVRSVYYNGATFDGIADIVLDSANNASLIDSKETSLLFKSADAVKEANAVTYTYRTQNLSQSSNSTGYIALSPPGGSDYFPYAFGALGTIAKRDILVISEGNYQAGANAAGTIDTTATSNVVTGSGGMDFTSEFQPGDHVKLANSTANVIRQVAQVTNTTSMVLTANAGSTITGNAILYFPNNVPISLTNRSSRTVTLEANGQLTIFVDTTIANATSGSSSSANVAVVYNVTANSVVPTSKSIKREIYARISIANNTGGNSGPWALGVSDAFRLRNVYKNVAGSANTTESFNSNTDVNNTGDYISLINNPFANGDFVLYTNSTTDVTGLTSGNTYYVIEANSTTLALSNTRNGTKLPLTAIGTSETHTLEGPPFYFAGDTTNIIDVTNDFYIDNNHKEDYVDTSYLYRKPRASALGDTDVLLVKFDAFDVSSTGVRTIKSYSVSDSANLASLSNTYINTMEIPEVVGVSGKYYDLRDQFDFRPTSANTIGHLAEVSNTTIVNPTEPSDANRFNSTEQKFPVPDTNLTANVTYYVGRNDRVVLDKTGRFTVVSGIPGVYETYPPQPDDSITLQILKIPPYPSLPTALSSEMVEIIDTKVANEKYGTRKDLYKVTTPIDVSQRTRIQTKGYTMEDIATLERRIKDLEYYVSFTLAETVAKMRFIPSSGDPTLDRYKFGFFVDPFTDYSFSDINNPEFYATVENDFLYPKLSEFNIAFQYEDGDIGEVVVTPPYVEYPLVIQNDCTDGPPTRANTNTRTTSSNVTVTTVTQSTATVIEKQKNTTRSDSVPYVYDDFFYTFSSLTGPAQIYMNSRDNNMAIEIFQGTSSSGPWTTTTSSASATAVTSSDITAKALSSINSGQKFEDPGVLNRKLYGPVGGFIEDHQKIVWNHNPSSGQYYRIRVYKGKRHGNDAPAGTYGYKLFYPTDTVTETTKTVTNPSTFQYDGIVNNIAPASFMMMMSLNYANANNATNGLYVADAQKFTISVTGLKPNTLHKFKLAGVDKTSSCVQLRTTTTNTTGLKTDNVGTINFEYYYDAGVNEATSDYQQANKLLAAAAGIKKFEVVSTDGASSAEGVIDIKYYSSATSNTMLAYPIISLPF